MPLTFEALKGQRFRWCFGGIQILRRHWRLMLPGQRGRRNHMTNGQRWAYLSGALQWYGDLVGLLFYVFLLVGAVNVAAGGGLLFRKLTGFLVAGIPLLVVLGFVRAVALLRRGTGASWRDALGAFMIWQSTGLVVARASVQGLFAREAEFLRTPKTAEDAHWWDAIRGNVGESALAVLGLAGIVACLSNPSGYGSVLAAVLLVWPTFAYASAPYNSLSAQRAALPPQLRIRRRTEYQRSRARHLTYAMAGLGVAGAAAALAVILLAPGTQPVVTPQLVGPARGHGVDYRQPATTHSVPVPSSGTPTPSTSSTATPTPSSSSTPSPTSTAPTSSSPVTSSPVTSSSASTSP
jgi:hypothetical protein